VTAILCQFAIVILLYLLYPVQRVYHARRAGYSPKSSLRRGLHIPSRFDPAPLLYPLFLPLVVSVSLVSASRDYILPNIVLGIASLPVQILPFFLSQPHLNVFHWFLTVLPLTFVAGLAKSHTEQMTLLYPLHNYTVQTVDFLTTTSLDPAEQYLLATILIDLYLLGRSAQSEILKALLWLGGPLLFVTCLRPLKWELALARIPSWRFRESSRRSRSSYSLLQTLDRILCQRLVQLVASHKFSQVHDSEEDEDVEHILTKDNGAPNLSLTMNGLVKHPTTDVLDQSCAPAIEPDSRGRRSDSIQPSVLDHDFGIPRRHTLPAVESSQPPSQRTTPRRRRKHSVNEISQSFLALTPAQAAVRRWAYAGFVYAAVLLIILGPIRLYVSLFSLGGYEPFGWALGYLLGNVPQFRMWVSSNGLATWIHLPDPSEHTTLGQVGWVESARQNTLGPANMRLVLCVYCLAVLLVGMTAVLGLSSTVEVDTRRKVFHGTMVAMLLPTVFIDPCFTSLALILILAIFLLLDLFRASQLPPISKPLTAFLAPYVDGRDHRGPVIVSHNFLLIGCAIPLWLSLAGVTRGGQDPWAGWDINFRDVSMVSGVVCVGMGDSAASLVGRRYGRHIWYWGGGKSVEGSLAFTAAVTVGLAAGYAWLRVGGWVSQQWESPVLILGKAWLAASGASLTEAVLTGANDNVVVPVMLWLLVRAVRL
jgi:dolichol kinase